MTGTSDAPGGAAIFVSRVLASPLYLVWKGIGATGAPPIYLNFLNSLLWGLAIVWIGSRRWGGFRQGMIPVNSDEPQAQLVQSTRHGATYSESGRTIHIEVEPTTGSGFILYLSASKQWNDGAAITDDERERVRRNILALFPGSDVC